LSLVEDVKEAEKDLEYATKLLNDFEEANKGTYI